MTKLKSLAALAAALFTVSLAGFGSQVSAQSGPIVNVSTEGELQQAIAAISSNTTILISPGTYHLTSTLAINKPVTNVVLRGATDNPNDVVISGRGMDNASFQAVPHGISTGVGVTAITIANLTVRDVYYHAIMLAPGTESPRIQNVRLINAGRQFVKAYPDGKGGGVDEGLIERSVFEYTGTSRDSETGGLEVHTGSRWTVRDNIFRNIVAPTGQVAGPAILFWYGSRDTVIERNTFINAQREIALGSQDRTPNDHSGGVVRNNFLYRESGIQGGQPAIYLADSPNTQVLHNTILGNGTATSLIQYRYPDTRGVVIRNNLLDGQIAARSMATGTVADNHTGAAPSMFVNAAAGNLHLASGPADIVDRAPVQANAGPDIDGEARPLGAAADFGADEYPGGVTSASGAAAASGGTTSIGGAATLAAATASGSSSLPSPWQTSDVGNPERAGAASWSSGVFAADGAGTDIGNRADQFRFIYQTLDGDGEVVARVDSLERTDQWAKAGVMIRDELTTGAKHFSALVTASRGTLFQRRIANDAVTTQTVSSLTRAPVWLKIVRKGNAFTGFRSTNGTSWTQMGSEVVYLNRLAYVGLVLTSRSPDDLSTATFSNVKVTAIASAPNKPPSVSLTAPDNGASYTTPATMNVGASASDTDGTIAAVEFYSGSTLIGSDSNSPYLVTWSDAPAGTHTLTAVARDNAGTTTTSASRQITISTPTNKPPSVTLTGPANGGAFTAPASIAMSATASDSDGTITRVDFYRGSTLLFSDTSSPYSWTWSNVAVGNYTVTAIASDNSGATATSAEAQIAVTTLANQPPAVSLSGPANGASFTAPASVPMTASATDMDGTITKVEFYAGSTLVSTDMNSPYSATWDTSTAGTFTLSAKAFDNAGASTISSGVNVTVQTASTSTLPAGWLTADVGNPAIAGSASYQSDTFTLSAAGIDIFGTADQFRYVYQPLQGDGEISACVDALDYAHGWTKAGVMIRESMSAGSPNAMALMTAGYGVTLHSRPQESQATVWTGWLNAGVPAHCLRLVRSGNVFRAYEAMNGTTWVSLGEQTINMGQSAFIGLALSSHEPGTPVTSRISRVSITKTPAGNQLPQVTLTAPANGTVYTTPATMTVSANASDTDGTIVAVEFYAGATPIGSDSSSPYSVTWSNAPSGTHSLTAVARDDSGATTTSGSRQVTIAAASNTPPTVSLSSPTNGATFAAPAAVSMAATATDMGGSIAKVEFYAGSTLVATDMSSPYSATWNSSTAGTFTLSAKAFDNAGASTISSGVNVTVQTASTSTLPAGWLTADVGNPAIAGSASYQSDTFTLSAAGIDIFGTADQFRYVYQPLQGDGEISACVDALDYAHGWTKAGVMIRESMSAGSPNAMALMTAGYGVTLHSRPQESQATVWTGWLNAGVPAHCLRLVRSGNVFRAYEAMNGTTWVSLGEQTINMGQSAFIGLALSSHEPGTPVTSRISRVSITKTPAGNQLPQVTLTAPANGTVYTTPATMTVSANASDTDGTIVAVEFYAGATPIGSDSSSPYSVTWSNAPSGTHSLTAVARDDSGATTTSGSRQVTIAAASNTPPTVSLSSPTNGATFAAPAAVSMAATATDMGGSIAKVEFYAGSTLVATDMSSPYSATWNSSTAGTFTLTAKAFDSAGASTISSGVNVTIAAQPVSPTPTVPTGWQSADIGGPWPAGSASLQSGTFTVTAAGRDIWDNSDQLHYVYWPLEGDGGISTCVQSVGFADAWTKAGVMIRGSLSASAPHAFAMLSAGNGATFLYRPGESQPSAHTPNVSAVAPHCVRIVRSGNIFRAYESLNGTDWNLLGEQAIAMPASAVIGLALSSATGNTTSTAKFSNVSLENSTANQPPQVTLTTPANNASFAAPGNVQLAATATDADGAVQSVSFYANGAHVGTPNAAPWSMTWSNVPAGTYSITAVARDNAGATRTSAAASITVSGSTTPPTNPPTSRPTGVVFNPSSNHDTSVNSYVVEFFVSGADISTATPVRTQDVGKPTPVSGEISVDVSATIQALAAGSYVSTVRATGPGGSARSAPSQPFVR